MGALRQMLINLEATTPGAGHWVLDQVPDSKELVDTLQDIITESFWAYKKSRTLKGRP